MPRRRRTTTQNGPSQEDVQAAVGAVEDCLTDLLREKAVYMQRCRQIRDQMATEYDMANDRGIKKKLLKKIIKERDIARKLAEVTADLEAEERNELDMLRDRLGDFANSPLGVAATAAAALQLAPPPNNDGEQALNNIGA